MRVGADHPKSARAWDSLLPTAIVGCMATTQPASCCCACAPCHRFPFWEDVRTQSLTDVWRAIMTEEINWDAEVRAVLCTLSFCCAR